MASSAQQLADQVADTISAHASAAESQLATERERVIQENSIAKGRPSSLPWESSDESTSILSQDLMDNILQLSLSELNFTITPDTELLRLLDFNFKEVIPQVMSLLNLDKNLARLHARVSPKMDEEIFWRNYYARIYFLRYKSGIDSPEPNAYLDSLDKADVIYCSSSPERPDPPARTVGAETRSSPLNQQQENVANAEWDASGEDVYSSTSSGWVGRGRGKEKELELDRRRAEEAAALAAEVEAELGDDSGSGPTAGVEEEEDLDLLADDDFEDLGDLDDEDDAELEAQIAKELAGEI